MNPIPDDYRGAIPYLKVHDGIGAVEFYKQAFGARESMRILRQDGKLAHGELKIGEATIMLRDEISEMHFLSPRSVGGTPLAILIYVSDVEALIKPASAAGAKVVAPPTEQFHGDLMAILEDPFGHSWFFATRILDLSPEALRERAAVWGI